MLQIYVYGKYLEGYLELPPGTTLQMDITYPAFDDELVIGEYSLPLEVEFTNYNRRLLGFPEVLNEQAVDEVNYWRVNVISGGVPEMQDAKMTLLKTSGTFDYRRGRFNFSISGNKGLFGSVIKNKKLTDLSLGGKITWGASNDSRTFATYTMYGINKYPYIRFGPVARENYFDAERLDYNNESLSQNQVNRIHYFQNGNWQFGSPKVSNLALVSVPGDPEYKDYRTIPFFQLYFVTKKIFEENGYSVTGDFFTSNYFEDLVIDNNRSLEKYHISPNRDVNHEITPSNHVPPVLIHSFLAALQKRFNCKITFKDGRKVDISFKQHNKTARKTLNITSIVNNQYERNDLEFKNQGFTLENQFDGSDSYPGDHVQDVKDKTLVATVKTRNDLRTLNINRAFTTDDIAFVTAENLFYQVANTTVTPVLWEVYSERLNDYVIGKGENSISSEITPLCTWVALNTTTSLMENKDMCAVSQKGSYLNNRGLPVTNSFGLRIFYCKPIKTGNFNFPIPKTFVHNRDALNVKRVPYSLSWFTDDGLYKNFFEGWLKFLMATRELQTQISINQKWWKDIQEADQLEILGIYYIRKQVQITLPIEIGQPVQVTLYRI